MHMYNKLCDSRSHGVIYSACRKQRFERITKDLKVTRVFSTLVDEMKAIGIVNGINGDEEAHCTDVMAPVAHADRSPVLLLMGGGMGAGKSTVLKEILEEYARTLACSIIRVICYCMSIL
jgi:hypothetical protein